MSDNAEITEEKPFWLSRLNDRYYTYYNDLKDARASLTEEAWQFMAEMLLESYKKEYELQKKQYDIGYNTEMFRMVLKEEKQSPKYVRNRFRFWKTHPNRMGELVIAEVDKETEELFSERIKILNDETEPEEESSEFSSADETSDTSTEEELNTYHVKDHPRLDDKIEIFEEDAGNEKTE